MNNKESYYRIEEIHDPNCIESKNGIIEITPCTCRFSITKKEAQALKQELQHSFINIHDNELAAVVIQRIIQFAERE